MRRIRTWFVIAVLALPLALAAAAENDNAAQVISAWQSGTIYDAGRVVTFEGASYKCLYRHTAVEGWQPSRATALWSRVGDHLSVVKRDRFASTSRTRKIFAPYIHMSETDNNLPAIRATSKIRSFTLAFIVSDGSCSPAWQGKTALKLADENVFSEHIERVQRSGGTVIISFGGYVGQELALACADVTSLVAAYQAVIDKYKVKSLDFDIEAGAASDAASIERRSKALAQLAHANSGLEISFTVPVLTSGVPQTALDLLKSAQENGVPVSVVNLMTMDYGQPVPEGNMGPAAIMAVESAMSQIRSLGLDAAIGITPMIGMNDSPGETFTLADAAAVFRYARGNKAVRRLSMWSVGRDRGGCVGNVSPTCSGITQKNWDFTRIFSRF